MNIADELIETVALTVEGAPKVKALEWLESRRPVKTYWAQDERGDLYWINQAFGSDSYYFTTVRRSDGATLYDGDDLGSAKAAAQADYEKRVLSCLEYTTPPARINEALKTAIQHIEHMAAWIEKQNAGYSFESLGEDMDRLRAALRGMS